MSRGCNMASGSREDCHEAGYRVSVTIESLGLDDDGHLLDGPWGSERARSSSGSNPMMPLERRSIGGIIWSTRPACLSGSYRSQLVVRITTSALSSSGNANGFGASVTAKAVGAKVTKSTPGHDKASCAARSARLLLRSAQVKIMLGHQRILSDCSASFLADAERVPRAESDSGAADWEAGHVRDNLALVGERSNRNAVQQMPRGDHGSLSLRSCRVPSGS
jgi:hypothetical protein